MSSKRETGMRTYFRNARVR